MFRALIPGVVCILAAACGGGSTPAPQQQAQTPGSLSVVDPATAASLTGTVSVDGAIAASDVIRMDGDPKCVSLLQGQQAPAEEIVSSDGKSLANVFVYIKEGAPQRLYPIPSTPVVIDQQKCRYLPRVIGLQVGQVLEIRNSDPLLHNVRAEGAINQPFDVGQPLQGIKTTKVFTTREVMIPMKCQVHTWMRGYVGVLEHPFFAVTDASGRFSLPPLPPGTYTLEAWHEKLGTETQQITVAAKDAKSVDFTFKVS